MELRGLYTAVVTPFDLQERVNFEGFRHNLRYQLENGVDGVVILGTTGEAPTLSELEKRELITVAIEELGGKIPVIVGTGVYSTSRTIETTRLAEEMGADAALIVTPYYNKPTQEGLYRHFVAICHAVSLPICIYNAPGRTGQNLQGTTLQRLLEFPTIIGLKEASGDNKQINDVMAIAQKYRPEFSIVSGDDDLTLALVAIGASGVISVASNLVPRAMREFVTAALSGDFERARSLHYQLYPFFRACFIETNPSPIKAAMNYCGMPAGPCRLPLADLLPESLVQLEQSILALPSEIINIPLSKEI